MQGEPLASSHLLTGSALATSLWGGISPSPVCLLFILACLFVSRQSCPPVLKMALPPGIPPCSSLQHQGRDLEVWWWERRRRTFQFSSLSSFIWEAVPRTLWWLLERSLFGLHAIYPVPTCSPYLPIFSLGVTEASNRNGMAHTVKQVCASPRLPAWGSVLGRCLQTPSQEVPGKRRSCFHLPSHLLLAFFSGISYSPKRDGNLAG